MSKPHSKPHARASAWKPRFLRAFANTGIIRAACEAAGIERHTATKARKVDPEFAAAWDACYEDAADALEAIALQRARTVSDTLLIFLLKGFRPEKYRDTYRHEVAGPNGGPVPLSIVDVLSDLRKQNTEVKDGLTEEKRLDVLAGGVGGNGQNGNGHA